MELSFFEAFKKCAILAGEDEFFKIYRLEYCGIEYVIKKTKRSAGKRTVIHCENSSVVWEQIYPLGISPVRKRMVISKTDFCGREKRGIVLVSGKPKCIMGLDESPFVSSRGMPTSDGDIYVMSWAAFKIWDFVG